MHSFQKLSFYPFLKIAVALILGMWLADCTGIHTWLWAVAFGVLLVTSFLVRQYRLQSALIFLSVFALGATLMSHRLADMGDGFASEETVFDAVVTSQPVMKKKVLQMDLWVTSASRPFKVRASIFRDDRAEKLKIGHGIRGVSAFEKPANFVRSTFDYRRYLLRHGYRSTVFLYTDDWQIQRVSLKGLSVLQRTQMAALEFRQQLTDRYQSSGFSDEQLAVISAMTLGDRSRLSAEQKDDYSISGGAHILALSGMHLGIIYMVLTLVLGVRQFGGNVCFGGSFGGDADFPYLFPDAQPKGCHAEHPCLHSLCVADDPTDVALRCGIPAFVCLCSLHPHLLSAIVRHLL